MDTQKEEEETIIFFSNGLFQDGTVMIKAWDMGAGITVVLAARQLAKVKCRTSSSFIQDIVIMVIVILP
jgi:hypothetical protein